MTIEIREATVQDALDIARIHVDSFLDAYQRYPITVQSAVAGLEGRTGEWRRLLSEADELNTTIVAAVDGAIVGFVRFGPSPGDERIGQIFSIHVAPDRTGLGIGGRLMRRAVDSLEDAGFTTATLWVVSDNTGARSFYERLGWRDGQKTRREELATCGEEGDVVDVVRYELDLGGEE